MASKQWRVRPSKTQISLMRPHSLIRVSDGLLGALHARFKKFCQRESKFDNGFFVGFLVDERIEDPNQLLLSTPHHAYQSVLSYFLA